MNILPLVLSLLLIFAFTSYNLLQQRIATKWEETSYRSFMTVERKLRSKWERLLFKEAAKDTKEKKTVKKRQTTKHFFESPREKQKKSDLSKLNLAPLMAKPKPSFHAGLYETAAQLIRELYEDKIFSQVPMSEQLEYRILDALIEQGMQIPENTSLAQLFPDDPLLKDVFYKMLKGTNTYQLSAHKGIAPFSDFFLIDPAATSKPIHFSFASKELLIAVLGKKNTISVMEEEKKKWEEEQKIHTLSKPELETVLMNNRSNLSDFEDLFDFAKVAKGSKYITSEDKTTGINLKKKL